MQTRLWRFSVLDRAFFRDGRPFNMGEMTWQESQFPPSGRTLQGAIRAAVLEGLDADFKDFAAGQPCYRDEKGQRRDLKDMLGDASSLGRLTLTGPFLTKNEHLLYPAPLDLVRAKGGGFNLLCVREDAPIHCDLGQVVLPRAAGAGVKTQEGKYLTAAAMQCYLAGDIRDVRLPNACEDAAATLWPLRAAQWDAPGLADLEPKMGLERDDDTRTAKDNMLYSVAFVRLRPGVGLGTFVQGLDSQLEPPAGWLQHLGGERKLAALSITDAEPLPWPAIPALAADDRGLRFKLVLTTPALFDEKGTTWHPAGFVEPQPSGGAKHWSGTIEGTGATFDVVSACIGKRIRIGGWDIQNKSPHPLTAYVPAGSVYFCRASEGERANIERLHGSKIGRKTEYGFGHILVATW